MSETIGVNVLRRAKNMDVSPQFDGYSGVRIFIGTDDNGDAIVIESGDTNGRTLEIKNPFGSQQMADNILADINGYQYQPMSAEAAQLNPAAEMGDGVTVNGVYSGIFVRATQFGRLMASNIAAPTDEEIEHEFAVESASDRQYTRFVQQTKGMLRVTNLAIEAEVSARTSADEAMQATLNVQASQIAARVTKTGGSQSSFGWVLNDNSHTWYAGNRQVMKVNSSGLEVTGKVTATSGKIGNFNIGTALWYNINNFANSGNLSTGVYIGSDGIRLGRNFSVNNSGNITANNITATGIKLQGTINFYNSDGSFAGSLAAADLQKGAKEAYDNYGTWNTGAGYGYNYNSATQYGTSSYPGYFRTDSLRADTIYFGTYTLYVNGEGFVKAMGYG